MAVTIEPGSTSCLRSCATRRSRRSRATGSCARRSTGSRTSAASGSRTTCSSPGRTGHPDRRDPEVGRDHQIAATSIATPPSPSTVATARSQKGGCRDDATAGAAPGGRSPRGSTEGSSLPARRPAGPSGPEPSGRPAACWRGPPAPPGDRGPAPATSSRPRSRRPRGPGRRRSGPGDRGRWPGVVLGGRGLRARRLDRLDGGEHLERARVPLLAVARHRLEDDRLDLDRHLRHELANRLRRLAADRREHLHVPGTIERSLAAEELVQDDAQRVQVHARVEVRLASRLLRAQVVRRPSTTPGVVSLSEICPRPSPTSRCRSRSA